ncbi:MAG: hypothetical protein JST92_12820 [Deltaproteobacteria bacterium]|nr:hypothetical protein [Deltaproteobacteria bacterium]
MRKPPVKKDTLLAYLERGIAMLHIDARREGVQVPPQHKDDPHLRLNLSYRYAIPDLLVDETKVRATLSFRSKPFECILPWPAVFGITSHATGQGEVWPEDMPNEVVEQLQTEARAHEKDDPEAAKKPAAKKVTKKPAEKRPALRAIDGHLGAEPEGDEAGKKAPAHTEKHAHEKQVHDKGAHEKQVHDKGAHEKHVSDKRAHDHEKHAHDHDNHAHDHDKRGHEHAASDKRHETPAEPPKRSHLRLVK